MCSHPYHRDGCTLNDEERFCLMHVSRWGSDGYPVVKRGRSWHVDGIQGAGRFPCVFKTKREAVAMFERALDIMLDKSAGRL
jgi:hypothetical protein